MADFLLDIRGWGVRLFAWRNEDEEVSGSILLEDDFDLNDLLEFALSVH